jgi:hypothetical protein
MAQTPKVQLYDQVMAASYRGYLSMAEGLPSSIDEAESRFGLDIYDRMARTSYVQGALSQLRAAILGVPIEVAPAFIAPAVGATTEAMARASRANEVADFVKRCYDGLLWHSGVSMSKIADDMLRAIWQGHSVAEITLVRQTRGVDAGRDVLRLIKPIRRQNYALIVDPYYNLMGIEAIQPGHTPYTRRGLIPLSEVEALPNYVHPDKLLLLTFGGQGNPAGESLLKAVYDPWKRIMQMRPAQIKAGVQFGGGIAKVTVGANARGGTALDAAGRKVSADALTSARLAAENLLASGAVAVMPEGTDLELLRADVGGFFTDFFEEAQREIIVAILTSARTMMEATRSSQADAGKAENLLDSVTAWFRQLLCASLTYNVNRLLVTQNFGADVAQEFLPVTIMGGVRFDDVLANGSNLRSLGYSLAPEHMAWLDQRLGFSVRTSHEQVREEEEDPGRV